MVMAQFIRQFTWLELSLILAVTLLFKVPLIAVVLQQLHQELPL